MDLNLEQFPANIRNISVFFQPFAMNSISELMNIFNYKMKNNSNNKQQQSIGPFLPETVNLSFSVASFCGLYGRLDCTGKLFFERFVCLLELQQTSKYGTFIIRERNTNTFKMLLNSYYNNYTRLSEIMLKIINSRYIFTIQISKYTI